MRSLALIVMLGSLAACGERISPEQQYSTEDGQTYKGADENEVVILSPSAEDEIVARASKTVVAARILDRVARAFDRVGATTHGVPASTAALP